MNRNSNSTYTSNGAVEYTAKEKSSHLAGYVRKRNNKSLVEHSHPIFLSELDELDELMTEFPNLTLEHRILCSVSDNAYRKPDKFIMYERNYYPIGWKDATRCAAQYGKHKKHPVPRRKTTQNVYKKKRKIYTDSVYYTDTARAQYISPTYGLGDVEEPADACLRPKPKKSKKTKLIA